MQMSLEKAIQENTAALVAMTAAYLASGGTKVAEKPAAKPAVPAAAKFDPNSDATQVIPKDAIKDALAAAAAKPAAPVETYKTALETLVKMKGGIEAGRAILEQMGAKCADGKFRATALKPEQYPEALVAFKAAIAKINSEAT